MVDSEDTVDIDGENRTMAERGRLPDEVIELSRGHFNNVIRLIARLPLTEVGMIRTLTYNSLKRIGVKRDLTKAILGVPRGSSQTDVNSIRQWMDKIRATDKRAVKQLIAIDATVCARG